MTINCYTGYQQTGDSKNRDVNMTAVITRPDTQEKLRILSADAQYDLACACSSKDDHGRTR